MTLVEFLRARLDEDETVALEATTGPWMVTTDPLGTHVENGDGRGRVLMRSGSDRADNRGRPNAEQIARHHPARVLAEVEAKRRIITEAEWLAENAPASPVVADYCAPVLLRLLAPPYADHPDYDPAWRP